MELGWLAAPIIDWRLRKESLRVCHQMRMRRSRGGRRLQQMRRKQPHSYVVWRWSHQVLKLCRDRLVTHQRRLQQIDKTSAATNLKSCLAVSDEGFVIHRGVDA